MSSLQVKLSLPDALLFQLLLLLLLLLV